MASVPNRTSPPTVAVRFAVLTWRRPVSRTSSTAGMISPKTNAAGVRVSRVSWYRSWAIRIRPVPGSGVSGMAAVLREGQVGVFQAGGPDLQAGQVHPVLPGPPPQQGQVG